MAPKTPSEAPRQTPAQRRRADRERLRLAAGQLLTPEGWMRWVLTRSTIRDYSAANCMLLAQQCHDRGMVPQHVCSLHAWRRLGRGVCKGERALRISAPVRFRERDEHGNETDEWRIFFKTAFVFELSQTETLKGIPPKSLDLHCEPLNGDSHAHLLTSLQYFAESLGYSVSFEQMSDTSRGWCDSQSKQIAIDARASANAQVRALIHECVHVLGAEYERYSRDRAEVIADTVTFVACASVGLATDTESIPYVASWGKNGALDAVTELAQVIDALARRLEDGPLKQKTARSDAQAPVSCSMPLALPARPDPQ